MVKWSRSKPFAFARLFFSHTLSLRLVPLMADSFPIDLSKYQKVGIDPFAAASLSAADKEAIKANIQLCRDAIVFFTACGTASGYGGHTGGAFDTVPEVCLLDAFFNARSDGWLVLRVVITGMLQAH